MWDLDTLHAINERAYVEYKRKQVTTPLEGLREKLRNARPPSISILLGVFRNFETYNDFVKLVREYLPEREKEILEKPTPHEQMACFASHFEDRYLPLEPHFRDGMCEDDYYELLHEIPIVVMGFSWEDYHELSDAKLGTQLMSYLFEPPWGDDSEGAGERVAWLMVSPLNTRGRPSESPRTASLLTLPGAYSRERSGQVYEIGLVIYTNPLVTGSLIPTMRCCLTN